jgi:ADP-heptose:LPS heptosyltransferase
LTVRRILLIRTDRIGDVVLTLPVVELVREQWPEARVTFLVRDYTQELVQHAPGVDAVILADRGGRPRPDKELLHDIRAGQFDVALHVFPRPRLAWLTWRAGIPVRVGTAYRWYSFLFNRRAKDHRRSGLRHEAVFNARLLLPLGVDVPEAVRPRLDPTTTQIEAAERVRTEIGLRPEDRPAILHPGSGGSSRDWPAHRFGDLARALAPRGPVVVTGSAHEAQLVQEVVERSGGAARACVGRMSLMELAAFIQRGSVFVANSTGPLHIAAAVGTPVVGFYPPIAAASVTRWGPLSDRAVTFTPEPARCPHCTGNMCVGNLCMEQIEVEDVVEGVKRVGSIK